MTPLLLAAAAGLLVLMGAVALRMMRTTGLESVDQGPEDAGGASRQGFASSIDRLGTSLMGLTTQIYGPARTRRLEEKIRQAGRPDGLTLSIYLQRQGALVTVGLVMGLLMMLAGQPFLAVAIAALLVIWMPLWLRMVSRQRRERIERELPDFLDVLGVTMTAGLSFRQAVTRVCDVSHGPLADEMLTVLREMGLGSPRRVAFLAMRDRVRSESVSSFIAAMLQAEELGVPLSDAMVDIAADVRREHAEAVRQQTAKAGPKASLVLTATIVPGAMLLVISAFLIGNRSVFSGLF